MNKNTNFLLAVTRLGINQIILAVQHPFLYGAYINEYLKFRAMAKNSKSKRQFDLKNIFPRLFEKTIETEFDRHYVYHTAWAARILKKSKPKLHIDISSSLFFVGITSAFVPIKFYDYRPADLKLSGLSSGEADLTKLPFPDNSIQSLSCMHVMEHIGLGRYGDPIDFDGDIKAINELIRVLAKGGQLLFVVPTGQARVMFNAHRVYAYSQIIKAFSKLTLKEFTLIPDDPKDGGLIRNATKAQADAQIHGCGCYLFTKK